MTTSVVRRGSVSTRATLTGVTEVQEAGSTVAEGVAPGVAGLAVSLLVVLGDAVPGLAVPPVGSEADGDAVSGAVAVGSASVSAGDGSGFGTSPPPEQAVSAKTLNATTRIEVRRTRSTL